MVTKLILQQMYYLLRQYPIMYIAVGLTLGCLIAKASSAYNYAQTQFISLWLYSISAISNDFKCDSFNKN